MLEYNKGYTVMVTHDGCSLVRLISPIHLDDYPHHP